ncbi:hypothetical protein ES288_A01G141800v1 [Gossypium darwinii]|uniref:VQ domain-containing protein n=1 Tax=Gossypium darwinii TaxID=34276 RepID=A0A5D2HMB4_GOSDA|nr:hypothetical protein ES288_A01G141800v1 [Gossypium darwinii]
MDSGNSSSMQSSSGGDEEYDSRPESVAAFLNASSHFNPLSNQQPSLVHHLNQPLTFFDPIPSLNYFNQFSQSQPRNSLLNFDGVRPRMSMRSEPNRIEFNNLPGSSLSSQSIIGSQGFNQGSFPSTTSMQSTAVHENGVRSSTQSDQKTSVVKNPKKRTRASRRAPTTVLTTDTTNFRAMVQEFTGIPAPPFSGSSYSRRLDLFGSGSLSSHLEPLASLYPLRPSAKRVQTTPFVSSSSSLLDAANITSTTSDSSVNPTAFNPSSSNYQLPGDIGLLKEPHNMSNLQNQTPILSFQSFLDPPPLHPSLNLPGFGLKSQGSSAMPSIDELGLSHGHGSAGVGGLQCHGVGLNDGNQEHLRPLDGSYGNTDHNSQRVNSCKMNYSASSSAFHHDKGLDTVSSRTEGTLDSWICPAE